MTKYEGKRKFEAEEHQLVNLFIEHCKKYGNSHEGVYNKADPTHYEKIKVQFLTQGENGENKLDIEIENVTWFIKIEFSEYGQPLTSGMWDPEEQCFVNVAGNGEAFFDLLSRTLFETEHQSDLDNEEHLSAMGYYEI